MDKVHFEDLTKINVPFGLLDEDTQTRMKEWEHGWEYFSPTGWAEMYRKGLLALETPTYRAKPAPLTQDTVPWHLLEPQWQWYIRTNLGSCNLCVYEPKLYVASTTNGWWSLNELEPNYGFNINGILKDHKVGTVDWKDSLQQRPEGV